MISHDATVRHYVDQDFIVIVTANAGYQDDICIGRLRSRELVDLALTTC